MAAKIAAHQAGLGVGFLPKHLIQEQLANGSLVSKASAIPRAPAMLYLGWRKNQQLGEAAKWFSQRLSQVNWSAVLLWWNITSNHRGSDNGLHGPNSVIHDAATI